MAAKTYISSVDRWLSHEGRSIKAGEEFTTEFPKGMRLGSTLKEVGSNRQPRPKEGPNDADLV